VATQESRGEAESVLSLAEELLREGKYDLSVINTAYATQLYLRRVLRRLLGSELRERSIVTLLSTLHLTLRELGLNELARTTYEFIRGNEELLRRLNEVITNPFYEVTLSDRGGAEELLKLAKSLFNILKSIEDAVGFRGGGLPQ